MQKNHRQLLLFAFALGLISSFLALSEAARAQIAETVEANSKIISTPELLQVMNPAVLQLGTIWDFSKRDLAVTLRNIHTEALHIERIRVTCTCLIMDSAPPATILQPQDEISFAVTLDAAEINAGDFSRMVLIEIAGRDISLLYITGKVQPMFSFEPGQILQLGSFAGQDFAWERSINIRSAFPDTQLVSLEPPVADELFSYELLSENPQSYQLHIQPKLPLPMGKLEHLIRLPVTGVENYGPVLLAIHGTVTGWCPVLEDEQLLIKLSELKAGEPIVKELRMVLRDPNAKKKARGSRAALRPRAHQQDADSSANPIAREELASEARQQRAFWEALTPHISARLPASVSMNCSAQEDAIMLSLSFPADFFARRRRMIIPFSYHKNSCGILTIMTTP
jgi:hypothetical protein